MGLRAKSWGILFRFCWLARGLLALRGGRSPLHPTWKPGVMYFVSLGGLTSIVKEEIEAFLIQ